ncbi:monovalent cation:proton antiporter-2 (CPA2) family protein [Pseudoruegeria sp. SK021]|uniref:monovalent cation:proton antiporter-2 (CPA2) family protein n=1 Tax=Pseudoruegeria sp. SK021 TaxID=1933035 RepID=UPI000A22B80E|nr:monovalent cation:proton antiporter-2 (CPA2) family protein [Pseudoruegeria sp. SK021]OSP55279.1 potassium transporter [Pseudoruegeria sp. SK021]
MEDFLFPAMVYLAAAVVAVPIAARLGLGSVLGYLLAGVLIGPVLHVVGSETQSLQHFAEFGVVMMLFLIGLELDPKTLWTMRHRLLGLGGLQVGLTTAAIMACGMSLGLNWSVALAIGLAFALSSTAIVLQTLSEKGLMQTRGGRSAFAVLLTQDIAVIPMLAFLPLLAMSALPKAPLTAPHSGAAPSHADMAEPEIAQAALAFVDGLPGWGVALLTLASVIAIVLVGIYLTRPVFSFIHSTRLREMYTALALLIVVSIACLMLIVGLSPALGTFLAGVVLANSEFRHELESDLQPFKGLLLGLFFITVGAGIDFQTLRGNPLGIVAMTLMVMSVKGAILYLLALIFHLRGRDRWLFTLGLAQAGEFGFVLVGFALQRGVIPVAYAPSLYLIIALSMMLTPLFFILYEVVSKRLHQGGPDEMNAADEIEDRGPIIIAGIGRFGQVVNRMVHMSGLRATVLDNDLATIQLMRRFGFPGFLGDPTRPDLLHAAGLDRAKVLVVAIDDKEAAIRLVEYARAQRPDLHIVARAHDRVHVYELYRAGANDIVREMFDSSLRAARYVLENMGLSEFEAAELETLFYKLDRHATQELAKVWIPGMPVDKNDAYIARAKALNKELETALVSQLDDEAAPVDETAPPPSR